MYPRILWELATDPLGSAEHNLRITGLAMNKILLEKLIVAVKIQGRVVFCNLIIFRWIILAPPHNTRTEPHPVYSPRLILSIFAVIPAPSPVTWKRAVMWWHRTHAFTFFDIDRVLGVLALCESRLCCRRLGEICALQLHCHCFPRAGRLSHHLVWEIQDILRNISSASPPINLRTLCSHPAKQMWHRS